MRGSSAGSRRRGAAHGRGRARLTPSRLSLGVAALYALWLVWQARQWSAHHPTEEHPQQPSASEYVARLEPIRRTWDAREMHDAAMHAVRTAPRNVEVDLASTTLYALQQQVKGIEEVYDNWQATADMEEEPADQDDAQSQSQRPVVQLKAMDERAQDWGDFRQGFVAEGFSTQAHWRVPEVREAAEEEDEEDMATMAAEKNEDVVPAAQVEAAGDTPLQDESLHEEQNAASVEESVVGSAGMSGAILPREEEEEEEQASTGGGGGAEAVPREPIQRAEERIDSGEEWQASRDRGAEEQATDEAAQSLEVAESLEVERTSGVVVPQRNDEAQAAPEEEQATSGGDGEDGEDGGEGEEAEEGAEGLDAAEEGSGKTVKCRCVEGLPVDCALSKADGSPLFKNRAVAAVCVIKEEMTLHRHAHQQLRTEIEELVDSVMDEEAIVVNPDSDATLQFSALAAKASSRRYTNLPLNVKAQVFNLTARAEAEQDVLNELERRAAVLVMEAVAELLMPSRSLVYHPWDMQPENWYYTLQNHKTLRERKDPFNKDHNVTLVDFADVEAVAPLGTCALVGNSGVLIGRPLGPLIDAHGTVMRLNQGPTQSARANYEAWVGGRTSIRLLNKKWTHNYGRSHQELLLDDLPSRLAGNSYTLLASRGNVAEFRLLWEAAQAIAVNEQRYPTQPLFVATRTTSHAMDLITTFRAGMQCATGKRYRGKNAASSGFLGLFMLLQRCQAISLFGFSLDECRKAGCEKPYHYFTHYVDSAWLRAHPSHSFALEALLIQALHSTRRVCLIEQESHVDCAAAKPVEWPLQLQAATVDGGGTLEQEQPATGGEMDDEDSTSANVISIVPRVSQDMLA